MNSRIKNQGSRHKIQESRKGYSRIKKKLNQDKYEKVKESEVTPRAMHKAVMRVGNSSLEELD